MLGSSNTVAWLTPHAAVVRESGSWKYSCNYNQLEISHQFWFNVDGKVIYALALSLEHLSEICALVLRLLLADGRDVYDLKLYHVLSFGEACVTATSLASLMEQCQRLKVLRLDGMFLDENICRVLGTFSRPDLEIELSACQLTNAGPIALAEVLGRNQGPTKLEDCFMDDYSVFANGLRGNSRLKSLTSRLSNNRVVANQDILAIASALRENRGLVQLNLSDCYRMSDETWYAVCDSLKAHPTLEILDVEHLSHNLTYAPLAPAVLTSWKQALVDMLKVNTVLYGITLPDDAFIVHELFQRSAVPYLETNRLRPRLLAIQKIRPVAYRAKVVGRALLSARTNPNRFWMLLSGNAEIVALSSTTTTTTRAARFYRRLCKRTPAACFYRLWCWDGLFLLSQHIPGLIHFGCFCHRMLKLLQRPHRLRTFQRLLLLADLQMSLLRKLLLSLLVSLLQMLLHLLRARSANRLLNHYAQRLSDQRLWIEIEMDLVRWEMIL